MLNVIKTENLIFHWELEKRKLPFDLIYRLSHYQNYFYVRSYCTANYVLQIIV